jgi:hypothetical protein
MLIFCMVVDPQIVICLYMLRVTKDSFCEILVRIYLGLVILNRGKNEISIRAHTLNLKKTISEDQHMIQYKFLFNESSMHT